MSSTLCRGTHAHTRKSASQGAYVPPAPFPPPFEHQCPYTRLALCSLSITEIMVARGVSGTLSHLLSAKMSAFRTCGSVGSTRGVCEHARGSCRLSVFGHATRYIPPCPCAGRCADMASTKSVGGGCVTPYAGGRGQRCQTYLVCRHGAWVSVEWAFGDDNTMVNRLAERSPCSLPDCTAAGQQWCHGNVRFA